MGLGEPDFHRKEQGKWTAAGLGGPVTFSLILQRKPGSSFPEKLHRAQDAERRARRGIPILGTSPGALSQLSQPL